MPSIDWDPALYEAQHGFVWQLAAGVLDELAPQPGEHILDLGCGTGQLTAAIAKTGASVIGLDASPAMVAQARQNYPEVEFVLADASAMTFQNRFDAVFSNAALHWMLNTEAVVTAVAHALNQRGRFVAECGGRGNIGTIRKAIARYFEARGEELPSAETIFHSPGTMAPILERCGFEVRSVALFDRPTRLDGEDGMERWLEQFAARELGAISQSDRKAASIAIAASLRPLLYRDGMWWADYRRLRFTAVLQ